MSHSPASSRAAASSIFLVAFAGSACVAYEAQDVSDRATLLEVESRDLAPRPPGQRLSYAAARTRLLEFCPAVREARRAFRAACETRDAGVRRTNPTLWAGPLALDGPGLTGSLQRGLEGSVNYALDWLSGRVGLAEDIDEARRLQAATTLAAAMRRAELRLRELWIEASVLWRMTELATRQLQLAQRIEERTRLLAQNGRGSLLDVRASSLDRADSQRVLRKIARDQIAARRAIAEHVGASLDALGSLELDALPREVPEQANARPEGTWMGHPDLAELRATHALREHELRLEVRKQYPLLRFGPSFEREGRTDRWGLIFGVQLPIFDSNARGIAIAHAQRESVRQAYLDRTRLVATRASAAARMQELTALEVEATREQARATREVRDLARAGVGQGSVRAWRYLDLARRSAEIDQTALRAQHEHLMNLLELERQTGSYRLDFSAENIATERFEADHEPNEAKAR